MTINHRARILFGLLISAACISLPPSAGYIEVPPENAGEPYISRGEVNLLGGLNNELRFFLHNPWPYAVVGNLTVEAPDDPNLEEGVRIPVELSASRQQLVTLNFTPPSRATEATLHVWFDGWADVNETTFRYMVEPPISVRLTRPATLEGVAVGGPTWLGGGRVDTKPALVAAFAPVRFEVAVENHGRVGYNLSLRISQDRYNAGLDPEPVSLRDLAPGERRHVVLAQLPPPTLQNPRFGEPGYSGTVSYYVHVLPDDGRWSVARSFELMNGFPVNFSMPAVSLAGLRGAAAVVFAPAFLPLGEPSEVRALFMNGGPGPTGDRGFRVTFYPPLRAQYAVQGPQSFSFRSVLDAGESEGMTLNFTPRVTGTWDVVVEEENSGGPAEPSGPPYEINVPGAVGIAAHRAVADVDVERPFPLTLEVFSSAQVSDATLHVATGRFDPPGSSRSPVVRAHEMLGGRAARAIEARPAQVPLGVLSPNMSVWANLTLLGHAIGSYNIVPYVVSGDLAYTGLRAEPPRGQLAGDYFQPPDLSLTITPDDGADGLFLLAPAGVVLAAALVGHWARRRWIR